MFALDLLFSLAVATAKNLTTHLMLTQVLYFPAPDAFSFIETRPVASYFSKVRECRYTGLVVPYERTWEMPAPHEENTMLPPEPGKVAGYAFVMNKKWCPDSGTEKVLLLGDHPDPVKPGYFMLPSRDFYVSGMEQDKEKSPKWLSQVLARIERGAEVDPKAKAFLEFSSSPEPTTTPTPASNVPAAPSGAPAITPAETPQD